MYEYQLVRGSFDPGSSHIATVHQDHCCCVVIIIGNENSCNTRTDEEKLTCNRPIITLSIKMVLIIPLTEMLIPPEDNET